MTLKFFLKKIVSLALIIVSVWQIITSSQDILFILPKISFLNPLTTTQNLYLNLIKKAIIISTGLLVDSFYGFALFIKPMAATKNLHLVFGILILIFSLFLFHSAAIDQILLHFPLLPFT